MVPAVGFGQQPVRRMVRPHAIVRRLSKQSRAESRDKIPETAEKMEGEDKEMTLVIKAFGA